MSYMSERRHTKKKEADAQHLFQTIDGLRAQRDHAFGTGKRALGALGVLLICLLLFGAWPFTVLFLE